MFEPGFISFQDRDDEKSKELLKLPSKTRQELLLRMGCDCTRWPAEDGKVESRLEPSGAAGVIGNISDITEDLIQHAPWQGSFIDDVDCKLQQVEQKMSELADKFFYSAPQKSESEDNLDIHLRKMVASLKPHSHIRVAEKKDDDGGHVEYAFFPGVSGCVPPPLPKMEPLPVLDQVTKTQNFPPSFKREWRRFFFSEASCYILQSSFWWVWLEHYKPTPDQQAALFTIMADRFVHLILSSTNKMKDELFHHFPRCLAQALLVVFCKAFPKSLKLFHDSKFLQTLCDLTSEWTTGVKTQPDSWRKWPMASLQSSELTESEDTVKHTMKESNTLSSNAHSTDGGTLAITHTSQERRPLQISTQRENDDDAPSAGPGPTFECVQFGITGRSPLFQHHLWIHQLAETATPQGPFMSRIQIKEIPPPTITYQKLLLASTIHSEEKYKEYKRERKRCERITRDALQEYHETKLAIERENKELLKHRHQVSVAAERLMAKYIDGDWSIPVVDTLQSQQNNN